MRRALLLIGCLTLLGQVTLLRELSVAFYGSELIYLLALGFWLLWTAAGAALGRRDSVPTPKHVRILLLLYAIALPALAIFLRGARPLFAVVPGAYLSFDRQLIVMALALLPAGLLAGLLFQWAAKLAIERGRTLAGAYAVESAGAVLGGLAATLALRWGLSNLAALIGASLGAALSVLALREEERSRILDAAAAVLALLLVAGLWSAPDLDRRLSAWSHPLLLATADTPYGRVTVTGAQGQVAVFSNDALAFETQGTAAEEFVHLAALQHPAPERVLVLGGGTAGLTREARKHAPRVLDCVELDEVAYTSVVPHLSATDQRALSGPPLRLVNADPRRWLREARRYDLILLGGPQPESGQANRYYTQEFFALCALHLEDDGILAFRLSMSENFWAPQQLGRTASVVAALRASFPAGRVLPGAGGVLLASLGGLSADPERAIARLEARGIDTRLVSPGWLRHVLAGERVRALAERLATMRVPVNRDLQPICFAYTQRLWLANFFPVLGQAAPGSLKRAARAAVFRWYSWALVVLFFLLFRQREGRRRAALVGVAGLIGTVLEGVLILSYQVRSGVLYQDIGLLLTLFMFGLAVGARALDVLARRTDDRGLPRGLGAALLLGFAVLSGLTAWLFQNYGALDLASTGLLLFAAGFLVAAVFAYASLHRGGEQRVLVSPLYAADLVGGCLGLLLGSLIVAPALGLGFGAGLMAALALVALILI